MRRFLLAAAALGCSHMATAQDAPPPTWTLSANPKQNACLIKAVRHDGSNTIDLISWSLADFTNMQVGFGLAREEARALQSLPEGASLELQIDELTPDLTKKTFGHYTFTINADGSGGRYLQGLLPITFMAALKREFTIDLLYQGQSLRTIDLDGSAAIAQRMGSCLGATLKRVEGRR